MDVYKALQVATVKVAISFSWLICKTLREREAVLIIYVQPIPKCVLYIFTL
jgi:hypothetical protein